MKAIILAAGRGSRMKELTKQRPKCLVELHGKTMLDRQVDAIREAGISEIAIVTGYKREFLANRGLIEFHNTRWQQTQMVSSLTCADVWLREEPCIVSYSDIFYCSTAVRLLMNCPAKLALTYDPNWIELWTRRFSDPLLDAETFRINPDQSIAEIGNIPKSVEEVQGQYMGLLRFSPAGWKELLRIYKELTHKQADTMNMTGILQRIIHEGQIPITAIPYNGPWGEVDSAEDLAIYTNL